MNETIGRLLTAKNLGTVLFNNQLIITDTNAVAKSIVKSIGSLYIGGNLLEVFPEFIGNEEAIQDILNKKITSFRLDYVNRVDEKEQLHFLNLLLLPGDELSCGLLILEDLSEYAVMKQELNQQKYELLLYRSGISFRNTFLSKSILGESTAIKEVRDTIQKLSNVPNTSVLLMGESGTGKNLVARIIHYSSMPAEAPFVDINCAALPENLIESELFGYEKGAFTNASGSRPGLLQEADGGTIFLDEIGELPLTIQPKLLSVLETRRFRRLGSNKSYQVKARIIAATNRDLQKEVARKKFREDLYYRLNVVSLTLPSLRTLGKDILIIGDNLLKFFNMEFKKKVKGFTPAARHTLLEYSWPGNVRELSNCLERAMIFVEKDWIDKSDLVIRSQEPARYMGEWTIPPTGISLDEVELQIITSALQQAGGNKSKAARLLGLTRDTLRYRLEKHKLSS